MRMARPPQGGSRADVRDGDESGRTQKAGVLGSQGGEGLAALRRDRQESWLDLC